jgi:TonB family protein
MTISAANIIAYSVQLAVLVAAAVVVTRVVRLRAPLPVLRFWQAILAVGIVLPFVQPSTTIEQASTSPAIFQLLVTGLSTRPAASPSIDVAAWMLYAIGAGVAIKMLWLALGLIRLRAIRRRTEAAPMLVPVLDELSASLQARASIAISDDLDTPATVGVTRPLILVPRSLLTLPHDIQRAVIAHELIHVRRRDWLHTIAEELWCAVLWFNPAARVIASRLALARETVVDEATIRLTRDRRAYAEALLAFANPGPHLPGVTALIGPRQLSQRISLIFGEDPMTNRRLALTLAVALLVAGTASSAAVITFPLARATVQEIVYMPGDGVSLPVVLTEAKPGYTQEAMQEKIQGSVFMAVVVGSTGDVDDVTVTHSLDDQYGLDQQAVKAMKQWKFKPAMKDGTPVACRIVIEMTFTLK